MADLAAIIVSDTHIQEFFSELPSLTYQYARYTDWFNPYLEKQLKIYGEGSQASNVKTLVDKIQTLLQVYEGYIAEKEGRVGVVAAEDKVIKCKPQPFVILRSGKNENYLDMQEKDGVVMSVSYVECEYVMSEPTG